MTARVGVLQRFQAWIASLLSPPVVAPVEAPCEQPLIRLKNMLVGFAEPSDGRQAGLQVIVDSLNTRQLTCKCRELLREGQRYSLGLLLQGVGAVTLEVEVEWVLISSFGHSAGLKVSNPKDVEPYLAAFLVLVEKGARG